ncbi:cationic amino acid transporter 4-like [Pomacea canaliculata]|nr:cationic amino acid transporter 4-like [Pomacea canaliculata]XP_025080888.1 cationic amino acid transporter 4-like [Pomacea canaliculata]
MEKVKTFLKRATRVKTVSDDIHETALRRCLNTFDMTLLGIGHMIGAGIYVLTGTVVRKKAGASGVLSYLFAGFTALLSALCYAEFGARVPKAGSAYSYTYVTIGEIWGFVIGWNIILEHMIGAASVARAWSGAIDSIFDGALRNGTLTHIGYLSHKNPWISEYPDLLATAITIVVFIVVATGAKFSINFNSAFTILNGVVIAFIIIAGFTYANTAYWKDSQYGGFFPYGFGGTLGGAASCFFAYIGFEGIAISSEEARNPEKSVPIATLVSLAVVTLLYMLVTSSLTLMVPYYEINTSAAFPSAFAAVGSEWAKYVVAAGTLLGMTTSLLGSAFSLPRSVYAMAEDGLLFQFLAKVHPKTQTPLYSVAIFGLLSALMALFFEIDTLVEFMSIGTLFAYTIVAASIIILRYLPVSRCQFKLKPEQEGQQNQEEVSTEKSSIVKKSKSHDDFGKLRESLREIPILRHLEPGNGVVWATVILGALFLGLTGLLIYGFHLLQQTTWWAILLVILILIAVIFFYLVIVAHEQNDAFLTFQIPLVPFIPVMSMFLNIALMMSLSYLTWIRLGIWMVIGFLVYFIYGIHFSRENRTCEGYGPMVEYHGDAKLPDSSLSTMEEEVKEQQPSRREEGYF